MCNAELGLLFPAAMGGVTEEMGQCASIGLSMGIEQTCEIRGETGYCNVTKYSSLQPHSVVNLWALTCPVVHAATHFTF